jgi:energy-converting hydrogenase Eha subunit A
MNPLIIVCIVVALAIIALVAFVAAVPLLKRDRPRRRDPRL